MTSPIVGGSPPPIKLVIANMAIEGTKTSSAPATIPGFVKGMITCEKVQDGSRSEIVSCFDHGIVKSLHAGVDRQYHERQVVVNQSENRSEGRVKNRDRLRNGLRGDQKRVHQPFLAQNDDPGIGPDEEARPKWDHNERQQDIPRPGRRAGNKEGRGISDKNAQERRENGVPHGDQQDLQPSPVEGSRVVIERHCEMERSQALLFPEAQKDEHDRWDNDEGNQPRQQRREDQPGQHIWMPLVSGAGLLHGRGRYGGHIIGLSRR